MIYKFESYKLFQQLITNINRDTVSFLFKGAIPVQQENQASAQRKPQHRVDTPKLTMSKPEYGKEAENEQVAQLVKAQPVRSEQKAGRNDLCPCGSGKKYKNCHGQGEF